MTLKKINEIKPKEEKKGGISSQAGKQNINPKKKLPTIFYIIAIKFFIKHNKYIIFKNNCISYTTHSCMNIFFK